jgi:hypothetical protein
MSKKSRANREAQIEQEQQAQLPKVYVSTPSLDGNMSWGYTKSVLDIQRACSKFGLKFAWRVVWGMSILPLARNRIISQFMSSGYDFLVMLDGDIEVDAKDIMAAVLSGKQFVGLPCSKRAPNFSRMQQFVFDAGKSAPPEYLSSYMSSPNFIVNEDSTKDLDEVAKDLNLVRAEKVGTGCVVIHRSVFEKFQEAYPGRIYLEPNGETEDDRKKNAPTQTFEYFRYKLDDEGFFIGEDFTFCDDWRAAGGEIWMKVDAMTRHYGTIHFTWDAAALQAVANGASETSSEQESS